MSVDGIWYVKLADGDVERVTLDQLDEAFQSGQIDESCMVLADGADQWMKLGELLGQSESAAPAPPAAPAPIPARAPVPARAPMTAAMPAPMARPVASHPPVQITNGPASQAPAITMAGSVRPVTADLRSPIDFGDVDYPAPSRKRWVFGALGAALVVGAGAFVVVTRSASSAAASSAPPPPVFTAAAAEPPPPAPSPQPIAAATPQPMEAAMGGPSSVMDPTKRVLSDDQKKKLIEADKTSKTHVKAHGGGGGGGAPRTKEKSSGFTTDGNKYDPLNSTL